MNTKKFLAFVFIFCILKHSLKCNPENYQNIFHWEQTEAKMASGFTENKLIYHLQNRCEEVHKKKFNH